MINADRFVAELCGSGVSFFTGVPDSLLKSFCAFATDNCGESHVIAANEGGAVALAAGHYLATGEPALVYMQNSGQGNAVNPLASLADPDVYSIPKDKKPDIAELERERAIEEVLRSLPEEAVVVSTTGMISREVYETRERMGQGHERDFLTVGSMGHALMIAVGIARAQPGRKVYCLDGDGASIMHLGYMAIAGQSGCGNLMHIVFNNAAHDSVGGQPTVGGDIDFEKIAAACGYNRPGASVFREIKVAKGARKDLGRPKKPPQANKKLYMRSLGLAV